MNSHSAFKPRTRNRNFLLSVIMMTAKMLFVIELEGFGARAGRLAGHDIDALIRYPGR